MRPRAYSNLSPKRGWSWETPPPPIREEDIRESWEADAVIIGGGISGLAAGARMAQAGLKVIIVDKYKQMMAHAGQISAVNTRVMEEKGFHVNKAQLARDWMEVSGSRVNEELLWLFLNRSAEAFEWFTGLAEGCLDIRIYEGCYRGPGFNEYPATHHIYLKEGCDRYQYTGGGMLACEILQTEFLNRGGVIHRNTRAEQLEKDASGRVVGFIARDAEGRCLRYRGTRAVVLATGDIGGDREMVEAFCPIALKTDVNAYYPAGINSGDGHKMAYWAGAAFDDPSWAPTLHYRGYSFFFLHVNQRGKRFMNEDTWMNAKSIRCLMQPGGDYAWTVMDAKWLEELGARFKLTGGQGMIPFQLSNDGMEWDPDCGIREQIESTVNSVDGCKADSLRELAEKMGVPADALEATAARYNALCALGEDLDFGKRSELLTTVEIAPFYAIKWYPALLDVFGGALTDTRMRVLDPFMEPIPGLYAVGNAAGGFYSVDYPLLLNGNSYGRALTWALAITEGILEEGNQ
ncbi:MAG: FAD-binding protein [Oscillospiraceae bacterium]|nr:FAD-binding protein [Oscillospiraceae bacterium]